jgi:hypothetical protein
VAAATDTSRSRKGRNFSNEEEMQVCRSQLCISQEPIVGNGQRKEAFWDRVSTHYNCHRPRGLGEHSARSIETKWSVIKHDVSKFCAAYGHCYDNRESGRSPTSPVADQSPHRKTQEEAVSETQEDYLSSPATARLLTSITTRQQQHVPPGVQNLRTSLHFIIVTILSQLQILQFLLLPLRRLVIAMEALEFFSKD